MSEWKVDLNKSFQYEDKDKRVYVRDISGFAVAQANYREGGEKANIEAYSNAHIIAAAPDLLVAAKLALAYLQKEGFHDGDAYPALLKAITKAEGK